MHLTLHLTARCNLRCKYCYAGPHEGGDMSFETAKTAIALALAENAQRHPEQSLGVIFFGGEPLLMRELIVRIVRYCREIEAKTGQLFHFKITTNGMLLDEAFLTDPDTRDIFIAMSHDGVQASQDANRVNVAGSGSFDHLSPKIDLLLKHKPYAPVMTVVNPGTLRQYADSVQYLYARGFKYLICSLNYGAPWDEKDMAELKRQYGKLADWYEHETLKEEKFYFSPFEVKIASHVYPGSCKNERCELGKRQISVAPNGRLYPCVQFVGDGTDDEYCIGDVHHGIDTAAQERLYAVNVEEKAECAACAIRERCNHFCGCLNRQTTGRIDQVSPVLCAHERVVLPIADKLATRLFKRRNALFIQKQYNDLYPLLSLVEDRTREKV
ncbi:MAG: radical SAM protein [Armatimonadota bacterium]